MMSAPDLESLLAQSARLPTLPEAARFVIATIDDENADADSLVSRLNTDPAVVARILAAANSSAFGLSTHVDTVRQAILILGLEKIRHITLATALVHHYQPHLDDFDPRALWRHSLGVATCASVMAERLGYNPETAFTAGLLHDIGQLLFVAAAPEAFAEVLRHMRAHDEPIITAERSVFGFDHAILGRALIRQWRLPEDIADSIGDHHDPDAGKASEMGDLIHVAELLSHALDLGEPPDNQVPAMSDFAAARLGINWIDLPECFGEIEARFHEITAALGLTT